jgi:Domain of unknown function (DUF4157)
MADYLYPTQRINKSRSFPIFTKCFIRPAGHSTQRRTLSFEPRFGRDFSRVRVHTGARAAESAHAINAVAYAAGHHIVFGAGCYMPETSAG